jgi:AcrR family transcriptional regulator
MSDMTMTPPPLSGRRAEAARNDQRIIDAARAVLLTDPNAPVAAVAKEAGVGIAALYRRYASKEELLQQLFQDSQDREIAALEAALADLGDPWEVFCRYAHRSLDAGTGTLSLRVAVTFHVTDELRRGVHTIYELMKQLVDRTQASGGLRPDVEVGDIGWLLLPVQAIDVGDPVRTSQMRHRYLSLVLDGLHASAATPLPGPPPGWDEFGDLWQKVVPTPKRPGSRSSAET